MVNLLGRFWLLFAERAKCEKYKMNRLFGKLLFLFFLVGVSVKAETLKYYVYAGNDPNRQKYNTALEICEEWRGFIQSSNDQVNPGGFTYITTLPSENIEPTLRHSTICGVTWERTLGGQTTRKVSDVGIYAGGCYQGRYPIGGINYPSEPNGCTSDAKCNTPFIIDIQGRCNAYCTSGETWDPLKGCVPPPETQSCFTQTDAPIDIIQGRKYRSETLIQSGIRYPFSLTYFFNNQRNQERTPTGPRFSVVTGDRYLAATKPPMTASEYQAVYSNMGVPTFSGFYHPTQHYGGLDQYWRHNFDEILQIHGSQYVYQLAKGYEVSFTGLGASAAYPHLQLQLLASGEEAFAGYKLTDNKTHEVKKFNSDGRLMKIERGPQDVLTLIYDVQNRLDRITNSEGAYIQLTYQDFATDSVYSLTSTNRSYPISAINNRGESVQITWGKNYQGKTAKFHLITRITEATAGPAQSARTFEYNDTRWPASITDQYFVADISSGQKQQTLHFDYDDLGRATFSGLAGVRQSDSVTYVDANTRVVTNALGKQATYNFADFNGVKRLASVTGEPTQNCVASEVSYEYDNNGNLSRKLQNGQITEYQYDSQGREISRTEAFGSPQARTITTEYHPTLNLPVRIEAVGRVEIMTYDPTGRLLTQKVQPTTP